MSQPHQEYFCPNCGATLDNQVGFDPNNGVWECSECGQVLFGDEVESTQAFFDDVVWRCDNCDAVLNVQPGFVDVLGNWICTECGYENEISEESIIDSSPGPASKTLRRLEHFSHFLEWVSERIAQEDISSDIQSENANPDGDCLCLQDKAGKEDTDIDDVETKTLQTQASTVENPSIGKRIWYHVIRKKIETKQSSGELVGLTIKDVYEKLTRWGFYKVKTVAEEDLEINNIEKEGTVSNIIINGYPFFESNSLFPFNATAIIRYHTLKTIGPPLSSKQAKGKNYQNILDIFVNAGFCNVEARPIFDLTFGWLTKDGAVEKIQIEGKHDFSVNSNYRLDANIVISYHTFKAFQKRSG